MICESGIQLDFRLGPLASVIPYIQTEMWKKVSLFIINLFIEMRTDFLHESQAPMLRPKAKLQ
jgi:hypothetical protein